MSHSPFPPGLYELLVTVALDRRLATIDPTLVQRTGLKPAEAANRIAFHLGRQIERAIAALPEAERATQGVAVARDLLDRLEVLVAGADLGDDFPVDPGNVLRAVFARQPDGLRRRIDEPLIPLLDTTLLTNAPGEPRVGRQVQAEIDSADDIDVLMAFIRTSGMAPFRDALRRHCADGRRLRVLTTVYTGCTQRSALDQLAAVGAEIRVSYDLSSTRLHAKSWLFHRASGFSTAYIGSSNLTHSAQVCGLEWNVRVSGARNPEVIDKVRAVFESYWENADFRPYDAGEFDDHIARQRGRDPIIYLSPIAITPLPFQERMLDQLALAREQGRHRNLLVSATGTGKTVMAALDYARLRKTLPRDRLLFVAHRKEILEQSQATFCHALRDPTFGESWVGGQRPHRFEHVFASIQSLNFTDLAHLPPDHFDVVIVDEFHHAAAPSYARLLQHIAPRQLLGLTATPERSDGQSVLRWFDDRIAVEFRLWDAIDQHTLTPFCYYGIHDGLDLSEVPWKRGRGYDVDGLTKVYTASDVWAQNVVRQFVDRIDDVTTVRALGFCASVVHARFMARVFNEAGITAVAVWGESPIEERRRALRDLADGRVRVVFSVDLFNEGIDVPSVDALLFLRPTDSPTLFLQQLGRGLRRDPGKTVCTVLDFVGQHRREFRCDRPLRALFGGSRRELIHHVKGGFPYLPAGCHMELDRKAEAVVLASIRASVPSRWPEKVDELRAMAADGDAIGLGSFLGRSGLDPEEVYDGGKGWSDLCEAVRVPVAPAGPHEAVLRRAIGRLLHVDDRVRLEAWRALLAGDTAPDVAQLDERRRRLARMLGSQLLDQVAGAALAKTATLQEGLELLWLHPQVRREAIELIDVLADGIDHLHVDLADDPAIPLQVHARYTRLEILAGIGHGAGARVETWQTGVRWLPDARADLFAFTLDKTSGSFSPTTRYRDYAISRQLIHWESQSTTRADSETGLRYRRHAEHGSAVFLFARLQQNDRAFWCLGPATYVRHEGERPMAITWRLQHPLPGDLFTQFAAAVA